MDSLRLAFGTLTILPTRPPRSIDKRVASWAMVLAPLVGLVLALPVAFLLWLLGSAQLGVVPSFVELVGDPAVVRPVPPLLLAALAIGLLAVLTRGMHLDGLADTADGLGSQKPAAAALAIMRKGDVGPFGAVTLILVVLVQVFALAELVGQRLAFPALLLALVVSRLALPVVCRRGVPAARSSGLGSTVADSVTRSQLLAGLVVAVVVMLPLSLLSPGVHALRPDVAVRAGLAAGLGLLAVLLLLRRSVRRLGGVTGDVMGACVETAFTVVLVSLNVVA